jgi:integrase
MPSSDEYNLPIDQDQFRKKFSAVLRILNVRQRPFYNTRHTHISVSLTIGSNPKWVAEQNGTSLAMIQANYGKYLRMDGDALLREYIQSGAGRGQVVNAG